MIQELANTGRKEKAQENAFEGERCKNWILGKYRESQKRKKKMTGKKENIFHIENIVFVIITMNNYCYFFKALGILIVYLQELLGIAVGWSSLWFNRPVNSAIMLEGGYQNEVEMASLVSDAPTQVWSPQNT